MGHVRICFMCFSLSSVVRTWLGQKSSVLKTEFLGELPPADLMESVA